MLVDPRWAGGVQRVLCPAPTSTSTQERHVPQATPTPITDAAFAGVLKHASKALFHQTRVFEEVLFTDDYGYLNPLIDKEEITVAELQAMLTACERLTAIARMVHLATRNHLNQKDGGPSVIAPSDLSDIRNYLDNAKRKP
jgi:hypothetical protein